MLLKDLSTGDLSRLLARTGIHLDTGAFTTRLQSTIPDLAGPLVDLYGDYAIDVVPAIDDFRVRIGRPRGWRHTFSQAGQVYIDGLPSFPPFPRNLVFPMLESAMNWCIAKDVLRYLTFHSAAVARDGRAMMLAGASGSGKSTLCAALAHSGWRLLSDELVLLRHDDGVIVANPRPISLKNEAIGLISELAPDAHVGPPHHGTAKGTIAFLRAPSTALQQVKVPARPELIIAPSFRPGASTELHEMGKAEGFMWLVENSVNYFSTMERGFDSLSALVDRCPVYRVFYSDLPEAVAALTELHQGLPRSDEAA